MKHFNNWVKYLTNGFEIYLLVVFESDGGRASCFCVLDFHRSFSSYVSIQSKKVSKDCFFTDVGDVRGDFDLVFTWFGEVSVDEDAAGDVDADELAE